MIGVLPVFGTEEALVDPMLLALDTTLPLRALSAKKPNDIEMYTSINVYTSVNFWLLQHLTAQSSFSLSSPAYVFIIFL